MSSDIAIRIEGLSKSYRLNSQSGGNNRNLREAFLYRLKHPLQRGTSEDFWSLKNIDLEIKRGEVVGIIGRNGAGKSTLLKVLSRITEPTAGRIELHGRVGALLEVGTGFHPELSGRENIFLNGAILGMGRSEIKKEFDAIVEFAGVDKFLDTPVKRYSSGMYVRLAFAVAAHLNPEILIIDEVLAVGDAEFQKKCLGKMQEVAAGGRTVLFVSHNLLAVSQLCTSACLLAGGGLAASGTTLDVLQRYRSSREHSNHLWENPRANSPSEWPVVIETSCRQAGDIEGDFDCELPIDICVRYQSGCVGKRIYFGIWLKDDSGNLVLTSANAPGMSIEPDLFYDHELPQGVYECVCTIPAMLLNQGSYSVTVVMGEPPFRSRERLEDIIAFRMADREPRKDAPLNWQGIVRPILDWKTIRTSDISDGI
ncbi:Teichoic acids export ATP-binding protein TagH [Rosistilla carotiformis]|uniref:Teichoic acids export ATP-binding protein TagH n=1 Tax=Rosistilla carotiformis TaxID=2528017 RepID=A0A518JLF1_9BACT|nr:ABC transporter ATP-binding protein [Rosistilla carotiformis]QDV66368.1 Teichoic acids export ATP-binding protein TagH [Rosistilla carotiformis]